ncbi:MAG TPA: (d)CMP kinase [Patescibacteria group bacterium]|nr:(d)CMP kinase [Patescibacteria group bacterium]
MTQQHKGFVIAIDGPVASGKGTIAPMLARKLSGFYLDTGIFFRCLALYCLEHSIDLGDKNAVINAISDIHITYFGDRVLLNKKDVTTVIRTDEVSVGSSKVALIDEVQDAMVENQRQIVYEHIKMGEIVIVEGRNIGTALLPDADIKIFLTASLATRAQRRLNQLKANGPIHMALADVSNDILERDRRDINRKKYPLVQNPQNFGYFVLDNSEMSEEKTLKVLLQELKSRGLY